VSSDDPDRRGLPPGASIKLNIAMPREVPIDWWSYGIELNEAAPQALLRDLHRPVQQFLLADWDIVRHPGVDWGGLETMKTVRKWATQRFRIVDLKKLLDGPGWLRHAVWLWRDRVRRAMREPYHRPEVTG